MEFLMDHEGHLLNEKEIEDLVKTKQGVKLFKEYCLSGKIAYSAQQAFDYLFEKNKKVNDLDFNEVQEFCSVIYHSLKYAKWDVIEKYLVQACKEAKLQGFPDLMGNDKDIKTC